MLSTVSLLFELSSVYQLDGFNIFLGKLQPLDLEKVKLNILIGHYCKTSIRIV